MGKREKVFSVRERERMKTRVRRARVRRELRCFWTPPFGHHYKYGFCANCGAVRYDGP
jgi:hypothetical protein